MYSYFYFLYPCSIKKDIEEKQTNKASEAKEKKKREKKGILQKIKSFFVHCGYFITNVRRAFKRRRAMKKRQKAEAERKRRQAERRRQERTASEQHHEDTGLVRVRTRRPPSGRRPSDGKR